MTEPPGKSLLGQFKDLVYGSSPVEFESMFSLEESVSHLRSATRQSIFSTLTQEAAVGPVSVGRVRLQHVKPPFANSFKPFFIGQFRDINGHIVLTGRFTMLWFVKAFLTFWFGFCALWTILATLGAVITAIGSRPGDPTIWILPFAGFGMFAIGIGFVSFARKLSEKDVDYLSRVIRGALSQTPK
jgi:hypothetical protein